MTHVTVNTYTHSVTYVADNILKSLKDIIRLSGLDPANFVDNWDVNKRGLKAWLEASELETVTLEIYNPKTDALIHRWDIGISYGWSDGDGSFWADTEQLKHALKKCGVTPAEAKYRLVVQNKPGHRPVEGWSSCSFRSTAGMVKQSLGTTIEHNGLGANTAYWRRA